MQLFHSPASPFVRKVMVLLHETGQLDDVEVLDTVLTPAQRPGELTPHNPLSKIPTLSRPDGPALYDSRVICAYLDDRSGGKMYGTGSGRWERMTLEATADGIMDAAVSITYEGRLRPEEKQWDEWRDLQWTKVAAGCAALNERWMGHLAGPVHIGQIAVGCALAYLDFRHDARNWRQGNDALAAWFAGFESRDSMVATQPPTA